MSKIFILDIPFTFDEWRSSTVHMFIQIAYIMFKCLDPYGRDDISDDVIAVKILSIFPRSNGQSNSRIVEKQFNLAIPCQRKGGAI